MTEFDALKRLPSEYWQTNDASEEARIFFGNPYIIESLGNLLPPAISLDGIQRVLDVGCGRGEWARRLTRQYPHVQVIGIDTSAHLIHKAVKLALAEVSGAVSFYQFNSSQPLDLPGESCDIVHIHSLASFIMNSMWSSILDEMLRVLKPGGWINIVDYEQGSTSSAAYNRLSILGLRGVRALGGSLSPVSPTYGVAARLYGFLVDAGLIDVAYTVHSVDFGIRSHVQTSQFLDDLVSGIINVKPFLLQVDWIDGKTFDTLVEQAKEELHRPDSCGYAYLISAIGRKDV